MSLRATLIPKRNLPLHWGFLVFYMVPLCRNFLEVGRWPSVPWPAYPSKAVLELGAECSDSFQELNLWPPILRLLPWRLPLAIHLLFLSRDLFIVVDALMAFNSSTCTHFDFDDSKVRIPCLHLFPQVVQQFLPWTYLKILLSPLRLPPFENSHYNYPRQFSETPELSENFNKPWKLSRTPL